MERIMGMRSKVVVCVVVCVGLLPGCGGGGGGEAPVPGGDAGVAAGDSAAGGGAAGGTVIDPPAIRTAERSGTIRDVGGTDAAGYPLATADRLEVLELLRAERFEELHGMLDGYQTAFEGDSFKEDWVFDAYGPFRSADSTLTPLLDRWVEGRPDDYTALLARGLHRVSVGFAERGAKTSSKTTEKQFAAMNENFDGARADLGQALELRPGLHLAYRARIQMDRTQGRSDDLEATYREACTLTPHSVHVHEQRLAALIPRWGGSYEAMEELIFDLKPAMDANPRLAALRGRPDWDRARIARKDDDLATAAALMDQALAHGPDPVHLVERGRILRMRGLLDESLADLDAALAMCPQDPTVLLHRGWTLTLMDRIDEAIASLEAAEALDPAVRGLEGWQGEVAEQLVKMGHREYEAARWDPALEHLKRAQRLAPMGPEPRYWKGRVYLKQENHDLALLEFEAAIALDPSHFESVKNIDWILAKRGEWDAVVEHWNQFLDVNHGHADAYLERAGTHRHKGDMASARADLKTACDLGQEKACALSKSL